MKPCFTEEIHLRLPGIQTQRRFLHLSDAHVAISSPDSPEEEKAAALRGQRQWTPASGDAAGIPPYQSMETHMKNAVSCGADAVFLTGDGVDLPYPSSISFIEKLSVQYPVELLYVFGNHESAGKHDRPLYYPRFAPLMRNAPDAYVRDYGEFLVVAIDDSSRVITPEQLDFLKRQLARSLPILLLLHIPIETESLAPKVLPIWGPSFMIGVDGDAPTTLEFCSVVRSSPQIAAIFAGHIHFAHTGEFSPNRMQYVAAPAFTGFARMVHISGV